ncbi:hypothetical protein, partial [Acidiphilium multivorum]|uniref:hypothetical protein n=1 Tax=Acidiphilium multivorum TaxID=62140 RepID=UPI001B8AEB2E
RNWLRAAAAPLPAVVAASLQQWLRFHSPRRGGTFERNTRKSWSEETKLVLQHLRLDPASGWRDELTVAEIKDSPVDDILRSVQYSTSQFGVDIMSDVDKLNPKFYSEFAVERFMTQEFHGVSADLWNEPSDIVNFGS